MEYVLIQYKNGQKRTLPIEEFECECIDSDERSMGAELCYELRHSELELHCYIYEYPTGCLNYKSDWEFSSDFEVVKDTIEYSDFFNQE